MKTTHRCPKCGATRIGRLDPVMDWGESLLQASRVGNAVAERRGFLGVTVREEVGSFTAFVCVTCGYWEQYVADPAAVPWERLEGFSWVDGN